MDISNTRNRPTQGRGRRRIGKVRIFYLDLLRVIACFLVIVNHTDSSLLKSLEPCFLWYVSLTYFFICKAAVPIFLMITGAVSLAHMDEREKNREKVKKIVVVILVTSLFYYMDGVIRHKQPLSVMGLIRAVMSIPTRSSWYLYLILALMLFLPYFQKLAYELDREELRRFCILSVGAGGFLPLLSLLTKIKIKNEFYFGMLSVYIGLLFCGHYLNTYIQLSKMQAVLAAGVYFLLLLGQVLTTRYFYGRNHRRFLVLDERTYLTITLGSACLFLIVKYLCQRKEDQNPGVLYRCMQSFIYSLAKLTFGIYLSGDWLIGILKPFRVMLEGYLPPFPALILYELVIFGSGALITAVLRKIPVFRKYL
ncbi:MAG: acyltransferase family protein [Blautia sp.]|nr:acyltransferase family protein [Blautia sp.]